MSARVLGAVLALSLLGNAWLGWRLDRAAGRVEHAEALLRAERSAAQACSDGVAALDAAGKLRHAATLAAILDARQVSARAARDAAALLATPPSRPDDLCASLAALFRVEIDARGGGDDGGE